MTTDNSQLTETDIDSIEARITELVPIIDAGQQAADERAALIRALRNHNPRRYTQDRLATLAHVSQQAVSTMLDRKRVKWHLAAPGGRYVTITGPTIEEAVLTHRQALAGIQGISWDGSNIVSVISEVNPQIVSYYNIEVDIEITTSNGNQIVHVDAASDTRAHEMRMRQNQSYAALGLDAKEPQ